MTQDHEHEWWQSIEERRIKVEDGVAVMPWGAKIHTEADEVAYPVETGELVCKTCGKTRKRR